MSPPIRKILLKGPTLKRLLRECRVRNATRIDNIIASLASLRNLRDKFCSKRHKSDLFKIEQTLMKRSQDKDLGKKDKALLKLEEDVRIYLNKLVGVCKINKSTRMHFGVDVKVVLKRPYTCNNQSLPPEFKSWLETSDKKHKNKNVLCNVASSGKNFRLTIGQRIQNRDELYEVVLAKDHWFGLGVRKREFQNGAAITHLTQAIKSFIKRGFCSMMKWLVRLLRCTVKYISTLAAQNHFAVIVLLGAMCVICFSNNTIALAVKSPLAIAPPEDRLLIAPPPVPTIEVETSPDFVVRIDSICRQAKLLGVGASVALATAVITPILTALGVNAQNLILANIAEQGFTQIKSNLKIELPLDFLAIS